MGSRTFPLREACTTPLLIYFRLNGSFEALEAGNIADALVDFTGGVCESVNLKDTGLNDDEERRLAFFNSMRKAMNDGSLVGASISVNIALFAVFLVRLEFKIVFSYKLSNNFSVSLFMFFYNCVQVSAQ